MAGAIKNAIIYVMNEGRYNGRRGGILIRHQDINLSKSVATSLINPKFCKTFWWHAKRKKLHPKLDFLIGAAAAA